MCTRDLENILIAGNTIRNIGHAEVEYAYESAAIKLHGLRDSIVAHNKITNIRHAAGIWLDYNCGNSRVTGNEINDVMTLLGGIYIEANREPLWVDGNVIFDIDDVPGNDPPKDDFYGGNGISVDITDNCTVAHNTLFRIRGHAAIAIHIAQKERKIMRNATAMSRNNSIINNFIIDHDRALHLDRPLLSRVDGNAYGLRSARPPIDVFDYNRTATVLWHDWQEHYQQDRSGFHFPTTGKSSAVQWRAQQAPAMLPDTWQPWQDYAAPGSLSTTAWELATRKRGRRNRTCITTIDRPGFH